ncbi:MAG: WD40 repeat domain-containing serine/threonine protein kinase [Sandaracinaceae bacterium]
MAEDPPKPSRDELALAPTMVEAVPQPEELPREVSSLPPEEPERYTRGEELGRGGIGRVLAVEDRHLGRTVALKELLREPTSPGSGVSAGVLHRFLREARVTGRLEHPGIVPVYELGRLADGTPYYTMRRIRGRSLADALRDADGPAGRLKLLRPFLAACEAVAFAHARGVVHRDLKPDNIMVGEYGETLVVDWGLAKIRGDDAAEPPAGDDAPISGANPATTLDGHAVGTPAYMSPEQARGDVAAMDERSDVWGLGAILFEILCGVPPFEGAGTALELLSRVREEAPPRVRQVAPGAPPELAAVADRALRRDPGSRYPSAEAVAAEVLAWQEGEQVQAYDYSPVELVRRQLWRFRVAIAAVSAMLVALSVVAVVGFVRHARERRARTIAEAGRLSAEQARDVAEARAAEARHTVAEALVARAEQALEDGDPAAAAVFATSAIERDPINAPGRGDVDHRTEAGWLGSERLARALSAYLEAEEARRFEHVRRIGGVGPEAALDPDARRLAFVRNHRVVVESLAGSTPRRVTDVEAERALAFVGDDAVVVDGDEPGVYAIATGHRRNALRGMVAVAASREHLAVARGEGSIELLDAATLRTLGRVQSRFGGGVRVRFAEDGARLLAVGPQVAEIESWAVPELGEPEHIALLSPALDLAPARHRALAAVALGDLHAHVVDLATSSMGDRLAARGAVVSAAWLSRRLLALAVEGGRVLVVNSRTGDVVDTLRAPAGTLLAGPRTLVALPRNRGGAAVVFRRPAPRHRTRLPLPEPAYALAVDGARAVAATHGRLYDIALDAPWHQAVRRRVELPEDVGIPARVKLGPAGEVAMVTRGGAVLLHRPGSTVEVLDAGAGPADCPLGLTFGPEGRTVYAGGQGGEVRRFDLRGPRELSPFAGRGGAVCDLALGPDGRVLGVASRGGRVRLLELPAGTARSGGVEVPAPTLSLAFSASGDAYAIGDAAGFLRVHRIDGSPVLEIRVHRGAVRGVAWDGSRLATVGHDRSVRLVTADGGRLTRLLRVDRSPADVAFAEDGHVVAFVDHRHLVRVPVRPPVDLRDPAQLRRQTELRAGVRLEGVRLVPE